jgi:hypothetical protein
MTAKAEPKARTTGVLADQSGGTLDEVKYLVRKLGIRPIGRAGTLRLFDQSAVEQIRDALARKRARQSKQQPQLIHLFRSETVTPSL